MSVTTNGPGVVWGVQTNISFSRPPHHSPQYNLLVGIVQPDYFNVNSSGVATNWIQRHGAGVSSSSGNYNTNQCATCHVPSYAVNANTNVTGHSFEMDTKNCTLSGCHGSVPNYEETMVTTTNNISRVVNLLNQWAIAKGTNTFGSTNATKYGMNGWDFTTTGALAPTPNTSNAGPSSGDQVKIPDAIKQARFNLYMVLHDGSLGVHNPRYANALTADAESKVLGQFAMANFKATPTVGFAPLSVTFTNLGTGVTSYDWNFGDGNTSTLATPTYVYNSTGIRTVTLKATGPSGSETVARTNYIGVYTRPVVTFTASPTSGKAPLTVNLTNTSSSTNSVTAWRWTINGVNISSTDAVYTFTNVYATNISYNVTLRASTPAGNVTTISTNLITLEHP
jgi:PKD repeat protein